MLLMTLRIEVIHSEALHINRLISYLMLSYQSSFECLQVTALAYLVLIGFPKYGIQFPRTPYLRYSQTCGEISELGISKLQ